MFDQINHFLILNYTFVDEVKSVILLLLCASTVVY